MIEPQTPSTDKCLLIGHRGVGKTSLLERISVYIPKSICFCLDRAIEKKTGLSIREIFSSQGEASFRRLEIETLKELTDQSYSEPVYIAVGAGYEGDYPSEWKTLWIQRDVDVGASYFLDRPSLDKVTGSSKIPRERFIARTNSYQKAYHEELVLLEGVTSPNIFEEKFFKKEINNISAYLTLLPHHIKQPNFKSWILERKAWGLSIELRDDLFNDEELSILAPFSDLLSFRDPGKRDFSLKLVNFVDRVDWPLEYGECPSNLLYKKVFSSLHTQYSEFEKDLKLLSDFKGQVKWAPHTETFEQLFAGHRWQQKAPLERSFLPISTDGRWYWYRLLNKMPIEFIREGVGSAADQPTLLQRQSFKRNYNAMAAVLGSPVRHSWTPIFHQGFFDKMQVNTCAITIHLDEFNKSLLDGLRSMGLRWAAVTSPLKKKVAQVVDSDMESINTLMWSDEKWVSANTDIEGFRSLIQGLEGRSTVLWGGGGVVGTVKSVLPQASCYSHRSKKPRAGETVIEDPEILIWGIGSDNWGRAPHFPDFKKAPEFIIDLNYSNDSPAIEYANRVGAKYISGQGMFIPQALEQQKIWAKK